MRWVAFLVLVLTLAAGCVLEDKPVDPDFDGGVEAGTCIVCPTTTPVCYDDTLCVECTADDERYCTPMAQVCKTDAFECVDCNASTECSDPDVAHCNMETNQCEACEGDADCNGILGLPRCQAGTCVQCTPAMEEDDCNGDSCNPRTFACTSTEVGSVATCEECMSDTECGEEGNRCVAMTYQGDPYPDMLTGFCLKTFTVGDPCERPYLVPLLGRDSLSGPPAANYCGINEGTVTCPAVLALLNDVGCPTGEDADCPTGGLCRDFAGGLAEDRCTYLCGLPAQCPAAEPANTCGSSGSGSGDYCGGG
jgi:hypothetical protein